MAMRYRNLRKKVKQTVGVYKSSIHGMGLFCKQSIDPAEMVIEYAGTVIRSVLTDKREKYYNSKVSNHGTNSSCYVILTLIGTKFCVSFTCIQYQQVFIISIYELLLYQETLHYIAPMEVCCD